jgi:hypothetical protein
MGLESLVCFLLFVFLTFFICQQAVTLGAPFVSSSLRFAGFVLEETSSRLGPDLADSFAVSDPVLPFRFQLPPPLLSL